MNKFSESFWINWFSDDGILKFSENPYEKWFFVALIATFAFDFGMDKVFGAVE